MPKIDAPNQTEPTLPKKKKKPRPILILVIVVVVVVVLGFLATRLISNSAISLGRGGDYQAVFLINGQVYFGRVAKENKDVVVLRNIYYLRATDPLQQGEQGAGGQSELSLIKLGNELHGPSDEMRIVRNNVLFIEDLKNDSKVTVAIEEYIADQED